jgi:hypothetical protein
MSVGAPNKRGTSSHNIGLSTIEEFDLKMYAL